MVWTVAIAHQLQAEPPSLRHELPRLADHRFQTFQQLRHMGSLLMPLQILSLPKARGAASTEWTLPSGSDSHETLKPWIHKILRHTLSDMPLLFYPQQRQRPQQYLFNPQHLQKRDDLSQAFRREFTPVFKNSCSSKSHAQPPHSNNNQMISSYSLEKVPAPFFSDKRSSPNAESTTLRCIFSNQA